MTPKRRQSGIREPRAEEALIRKVNISEKERPWVTKLRKYPRSKGVEVTGILRAQTL